MCKCLLYLLFGFVSFCNCPKSTQIGSGAPQKRTQIYNNPNKMKPRVLWGAPGTPAGSTRAKREDQSCTFFVRLAPLEPFWDHLGDQRSSWESSKTSFLLWSRQTWLQKRGPGRDSETGSKTELKSDPKWDAFESRAPRKSSSRVGGVRIRRKWPLRDNRTSIKRNESQNGSQNGVQGLPSALSRPTFETLEGFGRRSFFDEFLLGSKVGRNRTPGRPRAPDPAMGEAPGERWAPPPGPGLYIYICI